MRFMLRDYQDLQVCDLLESGFPLGLKVIFIIYLLKIKFGSIKIIKGR